MNDRGGPSGIGGMDGATLKRSSADVSFIEDFPASSGFGKKRVTDPKTRLTLEDWRSKFNALDFQFEILKGTNAEKDIEIDELKTDLKKSNMRLRQNKQMIEQLQATNKRNEIEMDKLKKLVNDLSGKLESTMGRNKPQQALLPTPDLHAGRLDAIEQSVAKLTDLVERITSPRIATGNVQSTYASVTRANHSQPIQQQKNGREVRSKRMITLDSYLSKFKDSTQEEIQQKKAEFFKLTMAPKVIKKNANAGEKEYDVSFLYVKNFNFIPIRDLKKCCSEIYGMDMSKIRHIRFAKVNPNIGYTVTEFLVYNSYVRQFRAKLPQDKPILEDFDPSKPIRTDRDDQVLQKVRKAWEEKMVQLCQKPSHLFATKVFRKWAREVGLWNDALEEEAVSKDLPPPTIVPTANVMDTDDE